MLWFFCRFWELTSLKESTSALQSSPTGKPWRPLTTLPSQSESLIMVRNQANFGSYWISLLVYTPLYFLETLYFGIFTVFYLYLKDRLSWFVTNSLFAPEIYIQNGNVLAKIEQADIGCTNGVIHIVSNVFRLDQFTVLDAIKGNNQLL